MISEAGKLFDHIKPDEASQVTCKLGQLKTETSNHLDWTALLNAIMAKASSASSSTHFTDDTVVYAVDQDSLKVLLEVVSETSPHVVLNFLGYQFAVHHHQKISLFDVDQSEDERCVS